MVAIMKCICQHAAQDKLYGQDNRLHNAAPKGKTGKWRCTVCNRERG